ncbi:MAG: NADH-quinone oxidoreductase subunit J [Myxococcales bacterium]|nr:NADH-quinone oxidoreductase subunit J [Myxococcales bacterium]
MSAFGVVAQRNPIRNAVALFVHVLSLAGLYATLSAHFLVAVQLIVYVGAVVVLFVFVIMLLGPASQSSGDGAGRFPRLLGGGAAALVGGLLALQVRGLAPERVARAESFGTLRELGAVLFDSAVLPFEIASLLLTAAVVGAFAVARGHHNKVRLTASEGEQE